MYVADLAAGLTQIGHDVTVYTRRSAQGQPFLSYAAEGYAVVHLPAGPAELLPRDNLWPHTLEFSHRLGATLDIRRPDILHGHHWMSAWATRFAAVPRHIAWAVTFHALGLVKRHHRGLVNTGPQDRVAVERQLARRAGRIIATSRDEAAQLLTIGGDGSRISVIPTGVDLQRFTPHGRADTAAIPGGRRQRHRIVSVGQFGPTRGFELLLTALCQVPDTELIIAGGGPPTHIYRDPRATELRDLAANLGIDDRLRLIGHVEQARMPELLRSTDLLVSSPLNEPYHTVAAQAMACGIPIVATAVNGLRDVVVNGVTGTLMATRNPIMFAEAIRNLLDNPARCRAYGLASRLRAEQRHSSTRTAELSAESYRRAAAS